MEFNPGDFFEDGFYHPCVCVGAEDGFVWGVSLIDGSYPRSTDQYMGGIRKITVEEAWQMKMDWIRECKT